MWPVFESRSATYFYCKLLCMNCMKVGTQSKVKLRKNSMTKRIQTQTMIKYSIPIFYLCTYVIGVSFMWEICYQETLFSNGSELWSSSSFWVYLSSSGVWLIISELWFQWNLNSSMSLTSTKSNCIRLISSQCKHWFSNSKAYWIGYTRWRGANT